MNTAPLGENVFLMREGEACHEGLSKTSRESMKKMLAMRKNRKPSINSMIPESRENSRSYLTNNKLSQQKD